MRYKKPNKFKFRYNLVVPLIQVKRQVKQKKLQRDKHRIPSHNSFTGSSLRREKIEAMYCGTAFRPSLKLVDQDPARNG